MKKKHAATALLLGGMLALSAMPLPASAAEGDILVTGFEDGDVSAFSKRGDTDTSVIGTTDEDPHSGKLCMSVTERSNGWNGPSLSMDAVGCEAGVQYIATAWVKAKWYNTVNLSMQYTDDEGVQHYSNLKSVVSQGDWVEIPATKFSFSEDMKDVQIYIEGQDKADLYVDDFSLTAAPVYPIEQDIPSLKNVYADYFKIGGAVTSTELAPKSTKDLILKHYNSITLGNELKPENMLDQKASQALAADGDEGTPVVKLNGAARVILNFCRDNNIPVRGHVLVWHSQTPGWFFKEGYTDDGAFVDKETMTKRMENYIKGVFEVLAEEYPDVDFYAWDVVNEAWLDDGKPRQPGTYDENANKSGWVQIWGDNSFIEPAFEFARKYAPKGCKLYYNDFNEYMPQKTAAIVEMATALKEKGLIDGIGCQSHLNVTNNGGTDPFPTANVYESALAKFAATGLDIQITELDATYDTSVENGEELQAKYYSDIMDAIVKYKDNISAVVFWGTTDDQSWRAAKLPLLFNEDYTAKPCFYSIIDGISYNEETTVSTVISSQTTTTTTTTTVSGTTGTGMRGDVNEDGRVTVSDAIMLARTVAEDPDAGITEQGKVNGDLDGVAGLSANDTIALLKMIAGLE